MKRNNKKKSTPKSQEEEIRRLLEDSRRQVEESEKHCEYVRQLMDKLDERMGVPKGTDPKDYGYYIRQAAKAREQEAAYRRAKHVKYWLRRLRTIEREVNKSGFIVSDKIIKGMGWGDN